MLYNLSSTWSTANLWQRMWASLLQAVGSKPAARSDSMSSNYILVPLTGTDEQTTPTSNCFASTTNSDPFISHVLRQCARKLKRQQAPSQCAYESDCGATFRCLPCLLITPAAYRTAKRGDVFFSRRTASTGFALLTTQRAEHSRIAAPVRRVRCPRRRGFRDSPAER